MGHEVTAEGEFELPAPFENALEAWPPRAHALAVEKGFYGKQEDLEELLQLQGRSDLLDYVRNLFMASRLALIHAEVSEALECVARQKLETYTPGPGWSPDAKPEGLPIELADVFLRLADLAGHLGIDLNAAAEQKHRFNERRPLMHGGKVL